jgi:hypothetical protein
VTPEQKKRFRELKKARNKWWDTVPKSASLVYNKFTPVRTGEKPLPAFCAKRDGQVVAVEVWIDCNNFKRVSPLAGTAAGRVWPTLEGAYLSLLEKSRREQRSLLDKLAMLDGAIKAYEQALNALR